MISKVFREDLLKSIPARSRSRLPVELDQRCWRRVDETARPDAIEDIRRNANVGEAHATAAWFEVT
jgi:hypothetical protein